MYSQTPYDSVLDLQAQIFDRWFMAKWLNVKSKVSLHRYTHSILKILVGNFWPEPRLMAFIHCKYSIILFLVLFSIFNIVITKLFWNKMHWNNTYCKISHRLLGSKNRAGLMTSPRLANESAPWDIRYIITFIIYLILLYLPEVKAKFPSFIYDKLRVPYH